MTDEQKLLFIYGLSNSIADPIEKALLEIKAQYPGDGFNQFADLHTLMTVTLTVFLQMAPGLEREHLLSAANDAFDVTGAQEERRETALPAMNSFGSKVAN